MADADEQTLQKDGQEAPTLEEVKKKIIAERMTRSTLQMKSVVRNQFGEEYHVIHVKLPFLIKLIYMLSSYWEWLLTLQICSTYFWITYSLFFAVYLPFASKVTRYLDIIFGIDTAIRLSIEVWRKCSEIPCIIFLVPYTLTQFLLDVLSLLPIEKLFIALSNPNVFTTLQHFDFCRFNRFLRFSRVFKFLDAVVDERRVSPIFMFILKYLTQYLIFLHFMACFFIYILPADPLDFMLVRKQDELSQSWIASLQSSKPEYGSDHFDNYAAALSLGACVVTTTGYGDITAMTSPEMMLMSASMMFGAIIISGFFSSGLSSFKLEQDGARFDLFFRLDAIKAYLISIKAHKIYAQKVVEYYNLLWNYREGVYDVSFMSELPRSVVEDMFYDICREMFHKSPLFRGLDESNLREVAGIVHVVIYNPHMLICTTGGYAMSMFYLLQGEVIIKSKLDSRSNGAILRAGCIIGEVNLFFSYPYTTTIETLTCCQLLEIKKFELFNIFENHPHMVNILRGRIEHRLEVAQTDFETIGTYPICWVEKKAQGHNDFSKQFPVEVRKATGFNGLIGGDVTDDTNLMIVDMPCLDKHYSKQHTRVFKTCVIPPILSSEDALACWWSLYIMVIACYSAFMAPYCLHFNSKNDFNRFLCDIHPYIEILFSLVYIADVLIEICYSCPVSGIYHKFKDGFGLKITELTFWIDLASTIPFGISDVFDIPYVEHISTTIRVLRLWKVLRYFSYLDNARPETLFVCRMLQAFLAIIYFSHLVACYVYGFACEKIPNSYNVECRKDSWLTSFTEAKGSFVEKQRNIVLGKTEGYWVAFYFAVATVTTTGFGDFNPQTQVEMIFMVFVQLLSFIITGYYTALLTSALCCTIRPKLVFQQKIVGVRQFLEHKGLDEPLRKRILEHYFLQDHLWRGVSLPEDVYHYLYDTPDYISEDAIYLEVELHFDGVPIFTKLDPKLLVSIAKLVRRYLVPPGVIFLRKGEVRRQMYVIGRGSVAMLSDKDETVPLNILDETGHFGIRDLLFGEPAHHDIKTLSYCIFFEVELRDMFQAMRNDLDLVHRVDEEKEKLQPGIDAMIQLFSARPRITRSDHPHEIPSFIYFPRNKKDNMRHCTFEEYNELFKGLRFRRIFSCILMRRAIHPVGDFAKLWTCFMSIVTAVTMTALVAETFTASRNLNLIYVILDLIGWVDIYFKMHWAYYTKSNLLISHPVKTATRYIFKEEFVFDLFVTTPFELLVPLIMGTAWDGNAKTIGWYVKLRWTRFGQIVRLPAMLQIFRNIFKMRKWLLLTSYVLITLLICTIAARFAQAIACPVGQSIYKKGDDMKLPFCLDGTYMRFKGSFGLETRTKRWLVGFYYISVAMFSVGYGDMNTLSLTEMKLLIFICFSGFAILRCIVADITSAEVDIDDIRHQYLEKLMCLQLIMSREKVPKKLRKQVVSYMYNTWDMSKGLQPRQLFRDLHPALQADLFREIVGDDLTQVPIFRGLRENVLRTICQYMSALFFRQGERITRFGNMEREMFVIVKGSVWIADKNLVWMDTLYNGESFGECSIIYDTRRNYNAIAASDVELFVLAAHDFNSVIQRYPTIMNDLKNKLPLADLDIFQTTVKESDPNENPVSISALIRTLLERNSEPDPDEERIFEYVREGAFQALLTRFWGSGDANEKLPFFYFTKGPGHPFPFLIHPKCGFLHYFNMLIVFICYVSPAFAAYNMFFAEEIPTKLGETIRYVTMVMEFPMYLHILLKFFTPFALINGTYCRELKRIAFNYITTIAAFPLDVISSIPLAVVESTNWRFMPTIRFLRLVSKLWFGIILILSNLFVSYQHYFYRNQWAKAADLGTSVFRYKVTLSMATFGIVIHGIACTFYSLAKCSCENTERQTGCEDRDIGEMCPIGSWTSDFLTSHFANGLHRLVPWKWYVRSVYWVITTVSTTGFGDITPVNTREAVVAIFTIFCGSFIMSVILSNFAAGIASLNKANREYFYQVNLLLKHMGNIGMSQDRLSQVISYFVMRWETCRGMKYHESTAALPTTLGTSLSYFLYSECAGRNKLFTVHLGAQFMRQLCEMFTHHAFIPGINIVNDGFIEKEETDDGIEAVGTMFLIYKGRVAGYGKNSTGRDFLVETLYPGQLFGAYSVLFYDMPYNMLYRAETLAEVLAITQSQVIELIHQYPQFAANVKNLIREDYYHFNNKVSVFEPRPEKFKKKEPKKGGRKTFLNLLPPPIIPMLIVSRSKLKIHSLQINLTLLSLTLLKNGFSDLTRFN